MEEMMDKGLLNISSGMRSSNSVIKPVIVYSYEPKVVHTEPSNFMRVVQSLTGSSKSSSIVSSSTPMSPSSLSSPSSSLLTSLSPSPASPSTSSPTKTSSPTVLTSSSSASCSTAMASSPLMSMASSASMAMALPSALISAPRPQLVSMTSLPASSSTTTSPRYGPLLSSSSLPTGLPLIPSPPAGGLSRKRRKLENNASKKPYLVGYEFASDIYINDDDQDLLTIDPDVHAAHNDHKTSRKTARLTTHPSLQSSNTERINTNLIHTSTPSPSTSLLCCRSSMSSLSSVLSGDPISESSMSSNSWSTCLIHPDDFCDSDFDPQVYQDINSSSSYVFDHNKKAQMLPRSSLTNSFAMEFLDNEIDLFGDMFYDESIDGCP